LAGSHLAPAVTKPILHQIRAVTIKRGFVHLEQRRQLTVHGFPTKLNSKTLAHKIRFSTGIKQDIDLTPMIAGGDFAAKS
jgi:hypothetical protein